VPVPTAFTEAALADYLHDVLGQTADALGLSPGGDTDGRGSLAPAVWQTVWAYGDGITAPGQADDLPRLLALARREAWRLAAGRAAGEFDFSSAGTSETRSQLRRHIADQLKAAEDDAAQYDAAAGLAAAAVFRPHDPYAALDDAERGLP
jgi:hypothetical protein